MFTFDLETQNHRDKKRVASPFDERNYIVQIGWSINGGKPQEKYYTEWHREHVLPEELDTLEAGDVINGFNIKFDLLWCWKEPRLQAALKRGVKIYCGQYAEYLLGGMTQDVQMVAMNDIAQKYGGGCKVDAVKEMWESGMLTSQIPRDLLTDYLIGDGQQIVGDIHNTWLIFVGQVARMRAEMKPEFRKMFQARMDGLLATTEMEYNGMHVDKVKAEELRKQIVIDLDKAEKELNSFIPPLPPEFTFNWGSPQQKSCLIFGGTVKYQKWEAHTDDNGNVLYAKKDGRWPLFSYGGQQSAIDPKECTLAGALYVIPVPKGTPNAVAKGDNYYLVQDRFLSGKNKGHGKTKIVKVDDLDKPKGAKKDFYFKFNGFIKPRKQWQGDSTDAFGEPLYSTGAEVIQELSTMGLPFTNALARYTSLSKDLGTYYWTEDKSGKRKGMLTLVSDDGIIHHKLNHTSTVTSRMSSSDPNMQNLPRGGTSCVKKMFTSRFGEDGLMAEIDYSQLEVVVQGMLSKDPQLCQDLRDKIDFHCKRLAYKLGEDYEEVKRKAKDESHPEHAKYKALRTKAKEFSFQRAYGAGIAAVVASTGMSKEDVEKLAEAELKLYPKVALFDQMVEKSILASRVPTNNKIFIEGVAFSQGEGHWDAPTGTRYIWREGITPEFMWKHGKYTGFSPTERKNYPIQGTGGEIVQTMLGKVFRYFVENNFFDGKVLLVNTVHDCVLLDGHKDLIPKVAKEVQEILERVPQVFNELYPQLDITVPFPCETEVGKDLFDMHVI